VVVSTGREQPSQPMDELRTEARMLTEALLERIEPWLQDGSSEPADAAAAGNRLPVVPDLHGGRGTAR